MTEVRKLAAIFAVVFIGSMLLGSCGEQAVSGDSPFQVEYVDVDGRKIPCITWTTYSSWTRASSSGISCDWSLK